MTDAAEALSGEIAEEAPEAGPLEDLLADEKITEIVVNGPGEIWVEREGAMIKHGHAFSCEMGLRRWVRARLSERGRKVDHSTPFADCTLPDGSRMHVSIPPVSRKGTCLSIRKFPSQPWSLNALKERGAVSPAAERFLISAMEQKKNIFISGGTGTGKTALLCALAGMAQPEERVIALEDIAEMKVSHPHFLSLEARPPNQEGDGGISLRQLLKESLRMRPDRILVGECRGPEALDLLLALNTGHAGSMGTIHGNSPRDALSRMETLALLAGGNLTDAALKNLIIGGIQVIVQLAREGGRRRIAAIAEVKGNDGGRFLLRDIDLSAG